MKNAMLTFNTFSVKVLFALASLSFSLNSQGQGPHATEVDLKAAYCLPYIKSTTDELRKLRGSYKSNSSLDITYQNIVETSEFFNKKLQTYLMARGNSHNSEAKMEVLGAVSAGEQALSIWKKISDSCNAEHKSQLLADDFASKIQKCQEKNGSQMLKLDMCSTLTFLPY